MEELYLDDALVGAPGDDEGQDDADHAPDGGEDGQGEDGGAHPALDHSLEEQHTQGKVSTSTVGLYYSLQGTME